MTVTNSWVSDGSSYTSTTYRQRKMPLMLKMLKSGWHYVAGDPNRFIDSELLSAISRKQVLPLLDAIAQILPEGTPSNVAPLCFYPLALLHHANYVRIDPTDLGPVQLPGVTLELKKGVLGETPLATAKKLREIADSRGSISYREFSVFITHNGRFKLEELEKEKLNVRRLMIGWVVALGIAIAAASLAAYLRSGGTTVEQPVSGRTTPLLDTSPAVRESSVR